MSIKLICHENLPIWVRILHVKFAEWLEATYPIDHTVTVVLTPNPERVHEDGVRFAGCFMPTGKRQVDIMLNCGWIEFFRGNRRNRCVYHLGVFAHEFVHYEKFRDKKNQNHRGLDDRARAIVKRFLIESCQVQ